MLRSLTATVTFPLQRGDEAAMLRSCTPGRNILVTCYSTVTMTVTFPGVTPHVAMAVACPPGPRHCPHRRRTGTVPALRRTVYFLLHSISRSLYVEVRISGFPRHGAPREMSRSVLRSRRTPPECDGHSYGGVTCYGNVTVACGDRDIPASTG